MLASPAHEIRGTVFDDVDADADVAEAGTLTLANASVSLYLDNGDGAIGAGDVLQATVATNAAGQYTFANLLDGTYYVVVDSKTLGGTNVWAEQTYGVAGAAKGAGFTATSGALFGGRNTGVSDDASSLPTAEHVTRVSVANANVLNIDYGFSFSAITSNRGDNADDDQLVNPGTARLQQGTLRQFILNSNAIAGVQTAHFAIGAPGTPVTIAVGGAALPTITDAAILDAWTQGGTGYSGPPLVELAGAGAGAGANGLTITAGGTGVRGFVINAFSGRGISISGAGGNLITANYIGTDSTGAVDRGNAFSGIFIDNSAGNTVGGMGAAERNVISGNDLDGVSVTGAGASGNQILGNYIGVNAAGAAPIGNGESAIDIDTGASGNVVRGNVLSGNAQYGIDMSDAATTLNVIAGNTIGLDAGGTVSIANTLGGVAINAGAANNTIGGTTAADRNVISGNASVGVLLDGASGIVVAGNYIGTDRTGTLARGNADDGVRIQGGATGNTVGGTVAGARNVISGNLSDGIEIRSNGNVVAGNYLGVDATGAVALGNAQEGIDVSGASNMIGGTTAGERNVISGNASHGVMLSGSSATLNRVIGNYIGTDAGGALDRGNADGVRIQSGANANTIGGTTAAERNVISGNDSDGIEIRDGGSSLNIVTGNFIGTTATGGAALANSESGVEVSNSNNTIGGTAANTGNTIAYNGQNGVIVTGASTLGVAVLGNSIYSNSGIGIDLGANGATPNDVGVFDADTGPNGLQNFPVLTGAAVNGAIVSIAGSVDSASGTNYRVEFFANNASGQRYLGSTTVLVGAAGTATFLANVTAAVAVGETITATATNLTNNSTSGLSAGVAATAGFSISGTIFNDVNGNASIADDGGAVFGGTEVRLHLDDGDGVIDSGDSFVGITTTSGTGAYSFVGLAPGTYYVVVNSRTIDAGAGNYNAGFAQANVWAEQTYGVIGAATASGFLTTPGSLYGGRNAGTSDNAAGAVTTAEHVTKVALVGGNVADINSAFSFNAIVNARGDTSDDDTSNARMQQGSLRQFILNANALTGHPDFELLDRRRRTADDRACGCVADDHPVRGARRDQPGAVRRHASDRAERCRRRRLGNRPDDRRGKQRRARLRDQPLRAGRHRDHRRQRQHDRRQLDRHEFGWNRGRR